jgi:hypothetical protein
VKIFYEVLDNQVYVDVILSEHDMVLLQEGSLICKNTVLPVGKDEMFDKSVCVGIIAPQALHVYDDIWDEELIEEEEELE